MNNTQTTRNIQHQQRIFRYALLILAGSVLCASYGVYGMFDSSRTAYEVQDLTGEIAQINLEIAQEESRYYETTQALVQDKASSSMIAYSPSSQDLRYAQVGGSVYSFATAINR